MSSKFGVNCWHENEGESAAMWNLYSGQGIAIESTVERLRISLGDAQNVQLDKVRYVDFDNDGIKKGHRRYQGFQKRQCFSHEKEFRVTLLLKEPGRGTHVKCDLDKLIVAIHISPFAPSYLRDAVEAICTGGIRVLPKPLIPSKLLNAPSYRVRVNRPV